MKKLSASFLSHDDFPKDRYLFYLLSLAATGVKEEIEEILGELEGKELYKKRILSEGTDISGFNHDFKRAVQYFSGWMGGELGSLRIRALVYLLENGSSVRVSYDCYRNTEIYALAPCIREADEHRLLMKAFIDAGYWGHLSKYLYEAVFRNYVPFAKLLVEFGANPDREDENYLPTLKNLIREKLPEGLTGEETPREFAEILGWAEILEACVSQWFAAFSIKCHVVCVSGPRGLVSEASE